MVSVQRPEVLWGKRAYKSLQKAYKHIKKDSLVNAEMVREDILAITRSLADHPKKYPVDKFKKYNETGEYRAFEKHSYRIAYRYTKKVIKVIRLRHVKQIPKRY